eukprot:scaffold82532_cov37-Tisochrysis_lutea.AAC.2
MDEDAASRGQRVTARRTFGRHGACAAPLPSCLPGCQRSRFAAHGNTPIRPTVSPKRAREQTSPRRLSQVQASPGPGT